MADRRHAALVTCSDRVAAGEATDTAGPQLVDLLEKAGMPVGEHVVLADERDQIAHVLRRLCDEDDCTVIVVTGGTGFAMRDVTPEATRDVIDREAPGLAEAMRAAGRTTTPLADLSRGVAGIRGRTLVLNVPGSRKGAVESLQAVLPVLPHALQLLAGDTEHRSGTT